MPDRDVLRSYYPDSYYGAADADAPAPSGKFHAGIEWLVRWVAARHVAFLARDVPRGGRILDVGCGRGVVLNPLAEHDFDVHGVEISRAAAIGLDPRVKLTIADRLAEAAFEDGFFDQVIVWHVLEHLVDPLETLVECRRILRPGGRLIVAVPNYSSLQARLTGAGWFHLDPPRHLYQFTLGGLRSIAERAGFVVRTEHHFSLRQNPFGWIQSVLNGVSDRPNRLYEYLQGMGEPPSLVAHAIHWLQLGLGALPALGLSVFAALLRSGATVHVVAEPLPSGPQASEQPSPPSGCAG